MNMYYQTRPRKGWRYQYTCSQHYSTFDNVLLLMMMKLKIHTFQYTEMQIFPRSKHNPSGFYIYIYRVPQEECVRLREGVHYIKV